MDLCHLEWLIGEPVPDDPEAILYEILPYSREDADRIIRHLSALAGFAIGQSSDDPAHAQRVRQAFRLIVDAARARQALLDLNKIDRELRSSLWRARLRDLRNDRRQFATVIGDKSACKALRWSLTHIRWSLTHIGQATRAGRRWLHYLRDHPAVLRRTIERALEAPVLHDDPGRPHRFDRVVLVEGGSRAYELLTGKRLARSLTSEGTPTGPGLRLVWICLKPIDPFITDEAVVWAIRSFQRSRGRRPGLNAGRGAGSSAGTSWRSHTRFQRSDRVPRSLAGPAGRARASASVVTSGQGRQRR